jgi:hypothetical protein
MKKALATISTLATSLVLAAPAFAAPSSSVSIGIDKPDKIQIVDIGALIRAVVSMAIIISGILVFLYLVWGGIQWITSGGDKAQTEKAQQRITSAIIGLAIVAASWALIRIIGAFFGLDIFDASSAIPKPF